MKQYNFKYIDILYKLLPYNQTNVMIIETFYNTKLEGIMNLANKIIDKNIYDICVLIHKLAKLDVEFLGDSPKSSFYLFNSQIPYTMQPLRNQTTLFMHNFLKDKIHTDFLYHTDNFKLSYIGVGFWKELQYKGAIIAGPFLSVTPDYKFISNILEINHLPLSSSLQLQQYYKSISILDANDNRNIGSFIINLTSNTFIHGKILFSKNINFHINTKEKNDMKEKEQYSEIELRYKIEKKLLNAVEKGLKKEALGLSNLIQFNAIHRIPNNPLRAYKNLTFSFNTLLRIASERGGVSPIYLDSLSDKFAILVEKVSSMLDLENVKIEMISEYCDLVNKFSTDSYSHIIRNVIDYINLNFHSLISLSLIAKNFNINSSYLSRLFKKQTGMNITQFINKKRIFEAMFLIKQNDNSITEIALMVGFENHNYFCTVFKKITSLTPRGYLNKSYRKK